MNESDWLSCQNPQQMLEFLRKSGNVSERKWRLFGAACSRRVWSRLGKAVHRLVAVAERLADGLAVQEDLERAAREPGALVGWNRKLELYSWLRARRVLHVVIPIRDTSEAAALLVVGAADLLPACLQWVRGRRSTDRKE